MVEREKLEDSGGGLGEWEKNLGVGAWEREAPEAGCCMGAESMMESPSPPLHQSRS